MNMTTDTAANWSLKEEIKTYWSKRALTFDDQFGHRILPGPEHDAWAAALRSRLGDAPLDVLELASGTGEVTKVLLSLGHRVTGVDFSETMVERSRQKHRGHPNARFLLGDAEHTMEPDGSYDAVVCRHLVWTLTDPGAALRDWAQGPQARRSPHDLRWRLREPSLARQAGASRHDGSRALQRPGSAS